MKTLFAFFAALVLFTGSPVNAQGEEVMAPQGMEMQPEAAPPPVAAVEVPVPPNVERQAVDVNVNVRVEVLDDRKSGMRTATVYEGNRPVRRVRGSRGSLSSRRIADSVRNAAGKPRRGDRRHRNNSGASQNNAPTTTIISGVTEQELAAFEKKLEQKFVTQVEFKRQMDEVKKSIGDVEKRTTELETRANDPVKGFDGLHNRQEVTEKALNEKGTGLAPRVADLEKNQKSFNGVLESLGFQKNFNWVILVCIGILAAGIVALSRR